MRLISLEVSGFRGFAREQAFDLDADAIVVVGANGNGKTSLFDAILWAISGRIPRLGEDESRVVCRFADSGQVRVVLKLRPTNGGGIVTVTRSFDGEEARVSLEAEGVVLRGPEAEGRIIQLTWPPAASAVNPSDSLATVLTRSIYLQQDLVRQFIDSVTEQERFSAVSELIGAGRVTELQGELERAKAAWTKSTNARITELGSLRGRLATMDVRLAELRSRPGFATGDVGEIEWESWWGHLQKLGLQVNRVPMASREATNAIDSALQQLDATKRRVERRQHAIAALSAEISGIATLPDSDLGPLRGAVANRRVELEHLRATVADEQTRVAELRRRQAESNEQAEQLRTLAILALKHLGQACPVCNQQYDIQTTRQRLETMIRATQVGKPLQTPPDALGPLLTRLAAAERALAESEAALRAAEQRDSELQLGRLSIDKRLSELKISFEHSDDRRAIVSDAFAKVGEQLEVLARIQQMGEAFSLRLSKAANEAAIEELEREVEASRTRLNQEEIVVAERAATGEQTQRIIEALRDATSRVVTDRVKEMEPLLSDMYSRIDVHPAFRVVRFLASVVRGKGLLSTIVSDPISEIDCDYPAAVLSSSQMNALAVCAFLAINLGMTAPPLETALLDDPLQSLDDINLLGLIDLLRRTKDQRQLCVSTHDARFGSLLARKLRPRSTSQKTFLIELEGWSRKGPSVSQREVLSDPAPIRLMAS